MHRLFRLGVWLNESGARQLLMAMHDAVVHLLSLLLLINKMS